MEILFKKLNQNHYTDCTGFPVLCPNIGCEKSPRNRLPLHRAECPEELVSCSILSCEEKMPRSQIDHHSVSNVCHHLMLLQKVVLELRETHHRKDTQIQTLLTELNKRNFTGTLTWDQTLSDHDGFAFYNSDKTIIRYDASISPRAYSKIPLRYGTIAFTYRTNGDRQSEIALVEKRLEKRGLVEGEGVYWVIYKTKQYFLYVDTFQVIASLEGEVRFISTEPQFLLFGTWEFSCGHYY